MRVTGAATLSAPAGTVQAALRNPDLLARAIPGCERLDVTGAGRCQLTVTTAIAAVSGSYAGEAAIVERREPGGVDGRVHGLVDGLVDGLADSGTPGLVVATVAAAGNRGSASAEITVRLTPAGEGTTQVSYDVDATVSGPIAGIGQRMLAGVTSRLAAEFLAALGGLLSELPPEAEAPAVKVPAEGPEAAVPAVEPTLVQSMVIESMVVGPTVVRRQADAATAVDQPRAGTRPAVRAGVVAGGAVGLAGILIGAVLGRRNRPGGRGSR